MVVKACPSSPYFMGISKTVQDDHFASVTGLAQVRIDLRNYQDKVLGRFVVQS